MKQLIKEITYYQKLYRDTNNGIAWIEDGSTGLIFSAHPSIDVTGSIKGMKKLGYWNKADRIIRSHGFYYNIDKSGYSETDELTKITYDECMCIACCERRSEVR